MVQRTLMLGVAFDLDGLRVRVAWRPTTTAEIVRYRQAIADHVSGDELVVAMRTLREKGFEHAGDVMKRIPRGYASDHPRTEWLRHRSLAATHRLGCDDWLHTSQTIERVLTAFDDVGPFLAWFGAHAAVLPADSRRDPLGTAARVAW